MPSTRSLSSRSLSSRSMSSSSKSRSSGKSSGQFYVILGLLLFIIIIGSILVSAYVSRRELFTNETKGKLIYLYMTNCGHCKEFSKVWDEIKAEVDSNKTYKFTAEKYELDKDDKGKEYAEKNSINYAPAILFENSKGVVKIYDGNQERTKDKILNWANTL